MTVSALLVVLILLPAAGAAACAFLAGNARTAKAVGLGVGVAELLVVALAWASYSSALGTPAGAARFQGTLSIEWIPLFGTRISLGVDGIALAMIALLAVLVPVVMAYAWTDHYPEGRTAGGFTALVLVTQAILVALFCATDVFLFYVLFEAMLVPMYFLASAARGGSTRR